MANNDTGNRSKYKRERRKISPKKLHILDDLGSAVLDMDFFGLMMKYTENSYVFGSLWTEYLLPEAKKKSCKMGGMRYIDCAYDVFETVRTILYNREELDSILMVSDKGELIVPKIVERVIPEVAPQTRFDEDLKFEKYDSDTLLGMLKEECVPHVVRAGRFFELRFALSRIIGTDWDRLKTVGECVDYCFENRVLNY